MPQDDKQPKVIDEAKVEVLLPETQTAALVSADVDLDAVVRNINTIYVRRGLEVAKEVGEFVLQTFFGGDYKQWKEKKDKDTSFRKLAEREDLLPDFTWINRAVRVVEQIRSLPGDLGLRLPYTHHTLLLPVKNEEKRVELAREAAEGGWSKSRLHEEVSLVRHEERKRKGQVGRPAFPRFVKGLNKLVKAIDEAAKDKITDQDFSKYRPEDAKKLLKDVDASLAKLERVRSDILAAAERFDAGMAEVDRKAKVKGKKGRGRSKG